MALNSHGIAKGKQITSYPSVKGKLDGNYKYCEERVVVDGSMKFDSSDFFKLITLMRILL